MGWTSIFTLIIVLSTEILYIYLITCVVVRNGCRDQFWRRKRSIVHCCKLSEYRSLFTLPRHKTPRLIITCVWFRFLVRPRQTQALEANRFRHFLDTQKCSLPPAFSNSANCSWIETKLLYCRPQSHGPSPGRRPRRAPGLCSAGAQTNGSSDV